MRISYVVPVHNEERIIRSTAEAIVRRLSGFAGSELILVENGSTDDSPGLVAGLARELTGSQVTVTASTTPKGVGNALREGMRAARGELVVLTAADLPFGFSDLERALALDPRPPLVIGSKAHPGSAVAAPLARRVTSLGFRILRLAVLGMTVGDSQGTLVIDGDLARRLVPALRSEDYLVSTEVIAVAAALGVRPVEVPVDYPDPRGDSKVHPVRDGIRMARGLIELRRRLRSGPPG